MFSLDVKKEDFKLSFKFEQSSKETNIFVQKIFEPLVFGLSTKYIGATFKDFHAFTKYTSSVIEFFNPIPH